MAKMRARIMSATACLTRVESRVRHEARQPIGDAKPALGLGQEHDAAVGRQASAIESSGDLLARHGWKRECRGCIVRHGGCGSLEGVAGSVSATKSYAASNA